MSHTVFNADLSWFEQLFELSPDPTWIIDGNQFVECNEAAVKTLGYPSRKEFLSLHPSKLSPPKQPDGEDSFTKAERMMAIAQDQGLHRFEWTHTKANGVTFTAEVTLSAIRFRERKILYCVWRDITKRKQSEEALRKSKHQYDLLASRIPVGIYLLRSMPDESFALDYASPRMAEMLNVNVESLLQNSETVFQAIHPDDRQGFIDLNLEGIRKMRPFDWTGRFPAAETVKWLHFSSSLETQEDGTIFWFGIVTDVTEQKKMEDQVRQLAFHDALTNLPNRRLLNDRLSQSLSASKRSGYYGALIFLDLDNFKLLNDVHGHEVGDLLLIDVAEKLRSCVREMDTVARFGGDEFVVLISELDADKSESTKQAGIVAEKIRAKLANPYVLKVQHDGQAETTVEHQCTACIGVALFGKNCTNKDDILKRADMAMYQAKAAGSSLIRFYDSKD